MSFLGDDLTGDICFNQCSGILPTVGWNSITQITSGGGYSWPCFQIDPITLRVYLLAQQVSGKIVYSYSDDDGYTFTTPSVIASGGAMFPTINHIQNGDMLEGWVQGTNITLKYKDSGTGIWSSTFVATGIGGTISTNTSFHLYEFNGYWLLTTVGTNNISINTYFSTDNGTSWTQLGTILTNSQYCYHPRMCVNGFGDITRCWVNTDMSIGLQTWSAGSTGFSLPVIPKYLGTTLYVANGGWGHMEYSWDYSNQLVLSIIPQGTSLAVNLNSTDEGATFSLSY